MYFSFESKNEWLQKDVPIPLVIGDVVFYSCNNYFIVSLYLSDGLQIMCGSCQMFGPKYPQMVAKNILANCGPLPVRT